MTQSSHVPALFGALLLSTPVAAADPPTGEQVYRQHCSRCHGLTGDGTKKAPQPLAGAKSLTELAKVIGKTMPEDNPGSCSADDVKKVAAYIYDAFYSPAAQARKTIRVELARLTVGQYRNAVADIVGSFRTAPKPDSRRGLRGEYFNARGFRGRPQLDRVDPQVRFDFGNRGPDAKFDAAQFSIRWEGSVLAPESGTYTFVVRTDHAARLWVNDVKTPLIDAWVKSGNDTEYRADIPLLAGRTYTVRLEFSKAKQGVDDSAKNKPKVKPAFVELLWQRPYRTPEVIPSRFLSPVRSAEVFVCRTPFPPDDRSMGWERGTTVSREWDAAITDAALEATGYVAARLPELAGVTGTAPNRVPKLRDFCRRFAERAFRRPLTEEQKQTYVDRQFAVAADPDLAVKRSVLLVLMSPRFLYLEAGASGDTYTVASRLALTLWDSLPDQELLAAAAAGKLATPDDVTKQAERMLADPRANAKVRHFLLTWLKVEHGPELAKDPKRFPGFDAATASDLRESLELALDDVVWGDSPDFRRLLQSDELFLNGRLARFYGAELPADAAFRKVKIDPGKRAGVLTHPYLLAVFAYTADSSPIHRGVFVGRSVLGLPVRPPPDAFTPLAANLHPKLTTRERVDLQTRPAACASCHTVFNPLGFTLENFDAVGRSRDQDNGKPVDTSGGYKPRTGAEVKFANAVDMARFLAGSEEVHTAFTQHLFHHLVKQPVRAYGNDRLTELRKSFVQSGFNVRKLITTIAVTAAMPRQEERGRTINAEKPR